MLHLNLIHQLWVNPVSNPTSSIL